MATTCEGLANLETSESMRRVALLSLCGLLCCLLAACGRAAPRPLLVLISVDTLRSDRLGVYGNPVDLTPHIDALMRESQIFSAAFATCSYTLPSVSALMTGRYPEEVGMLENVSLLRGEWATLAEVLGTNGWRSAAVVSNYVLRKESGIDRGFDFFDDTFLQSEAFRDLPERIAGPTTEAALRMLDRLQSDPAAGRFLWVHYQDPHGPYLPPEGKRDRFIEGQRRVADGRRRLEPAARRGLASIPEYQYVPGEHEVSFYRAGYDGEISYLDDEIGRLLAGLEERGLRDDAVIVFTADHGESLGENDYWFSHGEYLTDPLVRVPLSIRVPHRPPSTHSDPVSHVDVFPTLLSLFGIASATSSRGRSLLTGSESVEEREIYLATLGGSPLSRFGLIGGGYKYLVTRHQGAAREELYRLGDEERDLVATEPDRLREMRERLQHFRGRLRKPATASRQRLSDDQRARLRQLGYVVD